jgi:hypothetical protein
MRRVETRPPSFPAVACDAPLSPTERAVWQVLCGDAGHWRGGLYSPALAGREEVRELERHDCPELFLLLRGRLTLVLADDGADGGARELALEAGRPVLVTAAHGGYCPDGPHTGVAFVVERDSFDTEYRPLQDQREASASRAEPR